MRVLGYAALFGSAAAFAHPAQPPAPTLPTIHIAGSPDPASSGHALDQPHEVGSRLGLTQRDTPASVSVLRDTDLAERGITRAQDAAIRMPGVTEAGSPGNGGTALVARGFVGHNSVAQLVDGTRLVVAWGTVTYPFSTWPLESVQVLRGPASVLYGDGAIGAAVNYINKRPTWNASSREAFVGIGSSGLTRGGVGLRGPLNDVVAYSLYLDGERSDGHRENTAVSRRNYSLALAVKPTDRLKVTVSLDGGVNRDAPYFGVPLRGGQVDQTLAQRNYNVSDARIRYDDRIARAKVEFSLTPAITLRNDTYYLNSDRHWRNAEDYAFDGAGRNVLRQDFVEILHDQSQIGNRFDATLDSTILGRANRLVVGLDASRSSLLHTNNSPYGGSDVLDPNGSDRGVFNRTDATVPNRQSSLRTTAVFAENALDMAPRWKLIAGMRHDRMRLHDRNRRSGAEAEKSYSPTTGRIGVVWAATQRTSLYGQYALATDPLTGSLRLPNGSTHLDLTRAHQIEAGAKGQLPLITGEWTAAVYRIEKRNLLSRDATLPTVAQPVGRQSSTGIELAAHTRILPGWTVDANVALLRARYDTFAETVSGTVTSRSGNIPVDVPERMGNLWTAWQFAPQWRAGAGVRYVGKRPTNAANTAWLPAYTVVDSSLTYAWSRTLDLTLAVWNLTDRTYAVAGQGDVRWQLGAPRSVTLTARATF